jgi:hypothetical protein
VFWEKNLGERQAKEEKKREVNGKREEKYDG